MEFLAILLSLSFSTSAMAAWGDWDWFEPDDVLSIVCQFPADSQYRGAMAARIEITAEDEANKTFSADATIAQLYASEFKNGKEKEKFKFEAKDDWPFGSTRLALKSGATVKFIPNPGSETTGRYVYSFSAPFKSGDKEKKEVKSIEFAGDQGTVKIDKTDYATTCHINVPVCQELGTSGAGNGYGSGSVKGCHTEGKHVAKRYRGFRAYKTDMKDDTLLAELKVYSYEYEGERRLNMESRLRSLGSKAHGWDANTYKGFLDRLVSATNSPEGDRAEKLAQLKETLAKALAGE